MCAEAAARELAESMARSFLAAVEAGDGGAPEAFVQLFLPAAEVVAGLQDRADDLSRRLDAYAGALADLMLRDAEARGELDAPPWPDLVLTDDLVRDIELRYLLGGDA